MNRRDFIKVAVAGFGTVLAIGAAIKAFTKKTRQRQHLSSKQLRRLV